MTASKYKNPEEYKPGIVLRERGSGYDVPNARTITLLSHNNPFKLNDRLWDVESKEEGTRGRTRRISILERTLRDKYALPPDAKPLQPKAVLPPPKQPKSKFG